MSNYSYLKDSIKNRIDKIVQDSLSDVSIFEPPINYDTLYENAKLNKEFLKLDNLRLLSRVKSIPQ